jgi:LysM repeat protein/uncharacterized protein YkwD
MKSRTVSNAAILFLILVLGSAQPAAAKPLADPSGYDLVSEVNSYRLSMGSYELNYDSKVAAAAQGHADWIVETGNGGHTGAGGTDETMRVMAAGYGNGGSIHCDEAWAETTDTSSAVYSAWSDWTHQAVMLDYWANGYTDAGGGVASDGNGYYVFVFDICVVSGHASSKVGTAVATPNYDTSGNLISPTEDTSQWILDVKIATPAADGSIKHVVDYGQTLYSIATAYGVTIGSIRELNYMADDASDIYQGQELLIKKAGSYPTGSAPSGSVTPAQGEAQATTTLQPSFTPHAQATRTLPPMVLPSLTPTPEPEESIPLDTPQTVGIVIFTICGIGLGAFFLFGMKK